MATGLGSRSATGFYDRMVGIARRRLAVSFNVVVLALSEFMDSKNLSDSFPLELLDSGLRAYYLSLAEIPARAPGPSKDKGETSPRRDDSLAEGTPMTPDSDSGGSTPGGSSGNPVKQKKRRVESEGKSDTGERVRRTISIRQGLARELVTLAVDDFIGNPPGENSPSHPIGPAISAYLLTLQQVPGTRDEGPPTTPTRGGQVMEIDEGRREEALGDKGPENEGGVDIWQGAGPYTF